MGTSHCGIFLVKSLSELPIHLQSSSGFLIHPTNTQAAAKLMTDAAHYFEASICILCSTLAVLVLYNGNSKFHSMDEKNVWQTARHLGFSQLAALLSIGLAQQRYAFINMSIIRCFAISLSLICNCSYGSAFAVHQQHGTLSTASPPSLRSSSLSSLATTSPPSSAAKVKHFHD